MRAALLSRFLQELPRISAWGLFLPALLLTSASRLLSQQDFVLDSKVVLVQPPRASTRMSLPNFFGPIDLSARTKLGDVARRVNSALTEAGYPDQGWFVVVRDDYARNPARNAARGVNGFAVVTKLEEIDDNGKSKSAGKSWTLNVSPLNAVSFLEAAMLLLKGAPVGRYRVFLIWVANEPASQRIPSYADVEDWQNFLATGTKAPLLRVMDRVPVDYMGGCSVFVYEYDRSAITGETQFVTSDSRLNTEQHLRASGIWDHLVLAGRNP